VDQSDGSRSVRLELIDLPGRYLRQSERPRLRGRFIFWLCEICVTECCTVVMSTAIAKGCVRSEERQIGGAGLDARSAPRRGDERSEESTDDRPTNGRPILSGAPSPRCYNLWMPKTTVQSASSAGHDRSLLEWFATLTPEQRLAELESRISFFLSLRPHNESQLSRDTRASQ